MLDPQEISKNVLEEKYFKGDEKTLEDLKYRVIRGLAGGDESDIKRYEDSLYKYFIPAGRISSAVGTDVNATLINCFVQPVADATTNDNLENPGIYNALSMAAETMRRGGGVGYNFSSIRPYGAKVKGTHSTASGPISYAKVFDTNCQTIRSAGARRGAQMLVLNIDHPDIERFIVAKRTPVNDDGESAGVADLSAFNLSIAVSDKFMQAVENDEMWELVHEVEPDLESFNSETRQREDGMWVYKEVSACDLWNLVMESTYNYAEPGVLLIDTINRENNLNYCEKIEATNPCGEQPLPPYGCCCLGAMNLPEFIDNPFTKKASFNYEKFAKEIAVGVEILDRVLSLTFWPIEAQKKEAQNKRRIGLGYTGLANALIMLGIPYNSPKGIAMIESITKSLRDCAYRASVNLAKDLGPFPLFDSKKYLESPFIQRLPKNIQNDIKKHGIRNSHLVSIAPTGTISLAFADNSSGGIEPVFSFYVNRKIKQDDLSTETHKVMDHAYRLCEKLAPEKLKTDENGRIIAPEFVTALDMSANDHLNAVAAAAPYVDSAISKTVNVPTDYPFEEFKDLYYKAWKLNIKGITTYRPNSGLDFVLEATTKEDKTSDPQDFDQKVEDIDRLIRVENTPVAALSSLFTVNRPDFAGGTPARCYVVDPGRNDRFAVFISETDKMIEGKTVPFEVWVSGFETPSGMGALAKTLSMDMRQRDAHWLQRKLNRLTKIFFADEQFRLPLSEDENVACGSHVSALAHLIRHRLDTVYPDRLEGENESDLLAATFVDDDIKTGPNGTMAWTVDVTNYTTNEDFIVGLREMVVDEHRRPYKVWISGGKIPSALLGLCESLSYDMQVIDTAWIAKKLRSLVKYTESNSEFMARIPGKERSKSYPSTVSYLASLLIHRYHMLGLMDENGFCVKSLKDSKVEIELNDKKEKELIPGVDYLPGKKCPDCGMHAVIPQDGCDLCSACGYKGSCG